MTSNLLEIIIKYLLKFCKENKPEFNLNWPKLLELFADCVKMMHYAENNNALFGNFDPVFCPDLWSCNHFSYIAALR